jgi:hypothetical protein
MNYSEKDIQAVWERGKQDLHNEDDIFRKDACGAWIARDKYGDRNSPYGWEIDHIDPDGGNDLLNYQPLQWENNASKQDGPLTCPVTASGTRNYRRETH